jgi:tetratricopeptide (TPR) repeat protein
MSKRPTFWLAGAFLFAPLAVPLTAHAQFQNGQQAIAIDLPETSQRAITGQRIGLTDITIIYHRPLAGDRDVWKVVAPPGKVWRSGANENTTIEFTDPVSIEGQPLARGIYGLHMIPGEDSWIVVFSKNHTSWGSFTYDEKEDALRVTVKPQPAEFHDALLYEFNDLKPDSAVATLKWAKMAVPFKISVDVKAVALEDVRNQLRTVPGFTWVGWDEAARYAMEQKDLDEALKWADRSIQNEQRYENLMTKAEILDAMGRKDDAEAARKLSVENATPLQLHLYARQLLAQKQPDKAYAVFQQNEKNHPEIWFTHVGLARMYSAQGNFPEAIKEAKTALSLANDQQKPQCEALIKRLEAGQDVNK